MFGRRFVSAVGRFILPGTAQIKRTGGWLQHVNTVRHVSGSGGDGVPREGTPISRFPVPEKSTLPEDIQKYMDDSEKAGGFVPNVLKVLAYRPEEFRAFMKLFEVVLGRQSDSLTMAEKELVAVATSAANKCNYCVVAHSALLRELSKNHYVADQVAINWETASLSPRERAIIKFGLDVCNSKALAEEDFQALETHGLSRDDAWDIGAVAASFAYGNRMVSVSGMRPNEEYFAMNRMPGENKDN